MPDTLIKNEIAKVKRKICLQFLVGMLIVLSAFTLYYFYIDLKPINYFIAVFLATHLFFVFVPLLLPYETFKPLIPVYLIFLAIYLYFDILYFWLFQQITVFLWSIIFPVALTLFFEKKKVIIWNISILLLFCTVFIVAPFIPEESFSIPTKGQLSIINIMTVILSVCFILFFSYYNYKLEQIQESLSNEYEPEEEKYLSESENRKFDDLYTGILQYFSNKKPYCNPDFTIVELAKDLDTNVKYIARVIKIKENVNFNIFLNKYRINLVKEKIAQNDHNKYTLSYIYNICGFRHQSTFNKVFKEIEGVTPSEYINSRKNLYIKKT